MELRKDNRKNIVHPIHLSDTAWAIIGLSNMGIDDFDEVARLLGIRQKKRKRDLMGLIKTLRKTKEPLIREWMDHRLPPGACMPLPGAKAKVKCPLCRAWVNVVPCVACSIKNQQPRKLNYDESE